MTPDGQTPDWRPDVAAGIIETVRVEAGTPRDLDAHLARLTRSAADLYGGGPPRALAAQCRATAEQRGVDGRLRVTLRPSRGEGSVEIAVTFSAEALGGHAPLDLRTVQLPAGIGAHKWADRTFPGADPGAPGGVLYLDGADVLETDIANIFVVVDGDVGTPEADGRLLPGVTRALLIERLQVTERRVDIRDLGRASEVFATNAIRGVQPVRAVEGVGEWPAPGPVARRAADAVRSSASRP